MRLVWLYFFSLILRRFCPCNTIVQPPMVLQRNHAEMMNRYDNVKELNPMISCVKTIAEGWFTNKERVPVLIPSFIDDPGVSKHFFTELQKKIVTFSVAENFSSFENYQTTHSAVVLIRNSTDFRKLNDLNNLCAPRCKFVVCLQTFYNDEKSLLAEADAVVKALWKIWIVNAVIVAPAAGKFMVVGSYSFESNSHRIPSKPEILEDCSTLSTNTSKYVFHKLMLNNCQVNVTVFDCLPYAELTDDGGREIITGMEGEMFEVIAKSLNMSLNRLNISVENDTTLYDDLLQILDDPDGSDVAFCGLYQGFTNRIEYSYSYEMESVVWLVPPRPALSLLGLVTPLKPYVWFATISLLIFTGIIKVLLFRKISFLGVLGMILGVALPRQPRTFSNRIQFAAWIFFGYIITQSYLASLAGQLMNVNYDTITTMAELVKSGIDFGGTDRHKDLFKQDENPVSRRIYEKYEILSSTEYDEVMAALVAGENTSMALVTEVKISRVKIRSSPYDPHKLEETLAGYPIALAVWKGLPYLDQINAKISHLSEAGVVNHWGEYYANISSSMAEISVPSNLDMLHLSPSFLLLLLGYAFSLIVFLIEIGVYARQIYRFKRRP